MSKIEKPNRLKILNLYAGIGGNRKLWGDNYDITAVEFNEDIAKVYQEFYPGDKVVVGDAHQYLLDNYKEFDIIWSSPPCQSHSQIRLCGSRSGNCDAIYPDMKLWQEIIFLQNYASLSCKFVVENVRPFYTPFVRPTAELHRHMFWSNVKIPFVEIEQEVILGDVHDNSTVFGINLKEYEMESVKYKKQVLRNMVNPKLGKHIFDCLLEKEVQIQGGLF